jgi:flagellar basal-body rod modification protein FlgD
MPSVPSATDSSYVAANSTTATATAKKSLTEEDFLQLLSTQMQNQDPLKPMDDAAYLGQLAQFTSLQQVNTLSTQITQMRSDQQKLAAATYLGRTVTMDDGKKGTVSGAVTAIDTSGDTPLLKINGTFYPLSSLLSIEATPTSNTDTSTTGQPVA